MKKFLKPKIIIIGAAAVILVAVIAAAGWFFFLKGEESDTPQDGSDGSPAGQAVEAALEPAFEEIVTFYPFDRIPLKKSGNISSISMGIDLELFNPEMREAVEAEQYSLRQIIEAETEKMTWIELRNPEGKLKLKFALIRRINSELSESKIRDLYFTHFIMQ